MTNTTPTLASILTHGTVEEAGDAIIEYCSALKLLLKSVYVEDDWSDGVGAACAIGSLGCITIHERFAPHLIDGELVRYLTGLDWQQEIEDDTSQLAEAADALSKGETQLGLATLVADHVPGMTIDAMLAAESGFEGGLANINFYDEHARAVGLSEVEGRFYIAFDRVENMLPNGRRYYDMAREYWQRRAGDMGARMYEIGWYLNVVGRSATYEVLLYGEEE